MPCKSARARAMTVHGHHGQDDNRQVVIEGLHVLIEVGGKSARCCVRGRNSRKNVGLVMLDGDEPGQDHGETRAQCRAPEGAIEDGPLAAQKGKGRRR